METMHILKKAEVGEVIYFSGYAYKLRNALYTCNLFRRSEFLKTDWTR